VAAPAAAPVLIKGQGRVLIMDDEQAVRQTFVRMAAEAGYEAAAVASAAEMLGLYAESLRAGTRFDAVVVDLTTRGGEGGLAIMRRLLELDAKAVVIVSSGYADAKPAEGAVAFLHKPYRIEELSHVLAQAMRPQP
jgi:two-component system, cell cycle sensor histidine kinase and response regulator CckA